MKLIRESSGFSTGRMDFRGSADGEVKCDNLLVGRGASWITTGFSLLADWTGSDCFSTTTINRSDGTRNSYWFRDDNGRKNFIVSYNISSPFYLHFIHPVIRLIENQINTIYENLNLKKLAAFLDVVIGLGRSCWLLVLAGLLLLLLEILDEK